MNLTKTAQTVSLLIFGLGLAVNGYSQSFLTNGLVAYYPFNGNANDESGNGNNLSVTLVQFHDSNGWLMNPVAAFNASSDMIGRHSLFNQQSNWTWCGWINPNLESFTNGLHQVLCSEGVSTGVAQFAPDFQIAINLIAIGVSSYNTGFSPGNWMNPIFPHNLRTGYHQLVLSLKNGGVGTGTLTCYVDGLPIGSTVHQRVATSSSPLSVALGENPNNPLNRFKGEMDSVRIYNRALSPAEVQQLYVYESPPPLLPHHATATAQVVNGCVVSITITDPGYGYTNAPLVEISGDGHGAIAIAHVANGFVTGITITDEGIGYTNEPKVFIASPPFTPWLETAVSKVKVTQHVVIGRNYVLESSTDLKTWSQTGTQFTAQAEVITQEFDVDVIGRYFRIQQVP